MPAAANKTPAEPAGETAPTDEEARIAAIVRKVMAEKGTEPAAGEPPAAPGAPDPSAKPLTPQATEGLFEAITRGAVSGLALHQKQAPAAQAPASPAGEPPKRLSFQEKVSALLHGD